MSFFKPPVVASSVALLAALSLVPTQGWARDGELIYEMPPMSSASSQEIIFEMPPMKPAKGAQARKSVPKPAPVPALAAKPEPTKEAAPAQPPAPVAEAPKPVEASPPVAEAPAPAQPVAAQVPDEPPSASAEGQGAAQPPEPVEQSVVAEGPKVVEPAPIGPPIMALNPPLKALSALKAPEVALDDRILSPQDEAALRSLAPPLLSLAPEAAATVAAQPAAEIPAEPQAQSAPGAPDEPAVADAEADARISALLAEGLIGPVDVRIGDRATLWLPAGRVFLPRETAHKLAQEAGLEWRPGIQGMVVPAGDTLEWLAPVELLDDGYIPSGEPDSLQPEKLLAAFQASLPDINAQRARGGLPPVTLDGWLSAPALNDKHRLSACVNVSTQNDPNGLDRFFNCEAWTLGRQGAIKVGLADGDDGAARLKDEAAALADAIVFDRGRTYEEFDAATDKTAPYAAADLLTRDVAARTAAPVPAVEEPRGGGLSDLISSLFYPALFGVAALGLYIFVKRRREATAEDDAQAKAAPTRKGIETAPIAAKEKSAAEPSPSLFARLLPTLHARFARKPALPPEIVAGPVARAAAAPGSASARAEKLEAKASALIAKLAALRSSKRQETKPAAVAASPSNEAEEPVSALKKLADRMRRTSEARVSASVDVSRVIRPSRIIGGAAAAVAEIVDEPLIVETEKTAKTEPEFRLLDDDFRLVEPGDVNAASSAMDAARNRRALDR